MSRKSAREHAFKILYQMQFTPEEVADTIDSYLNSFVEEPVDDADHAFITEELLGVSEHQAEIDERIAPALNGWTLSRLSKVDLSILRLATFEIMYQKDIPTSVSINEAVNLAKTYSQDAAPAFINGVLGSVVPEEERR